MTDGFCFFCCFAFGRRVPGACPPREGDFLIPAYATVPLTVPLLCSGCGGGFEAKGADQVERRVAQVHLVQRGPQVDDITLLATARVEAVEHVLVQVDAEGATATVPPVNRTRATPLRTAATQPTGQAQVLEHPSQRQLLLQVPEVEERAVANRLFRCYTGRTGCGDHFRRRSRSRLVARSLVLDRL